MLKFKVKNDCSAVTNTVYYPETEVYFSNPLGEGKADADTVIYVQNADITVIKNVNRYDPIPGDVLTYTLDIRNQGLHDANEVSIVDTLPQGVCYEANSTTILTSNWTMGEPTIVSTTP